ncbi:carbohydrate-binding module family 1 protein [Panaeolus papilionaceus]|nr:carbohydrate-binding module family 1 protein [Panaeolus papilionaceus]
MTKLTIIAALTSALIGGALAQSTAPQYGQCGGIGWSGPTACPSGWGCVKSGDYYSQCLPGAPTATPTSGGGGNPTTTNPGGSVPTLMSGWNFIRAVTAPNFHKYLQSEVKNKASDAVLGEAVNAGQFKITDGQLIQYAGGTNLYAVVAPKTDSSATKLKVTWSTTKDTLGQFKFSGDTVEWSSSTVTRPQTNAWLICPDSAGNKEVFINLGAYGYQTPAGCNDHTIHGFTGTTPD